MLALHQRVLLPINFNADSFRAVENNFTADIKCRERLVFLVTKKNKKIRLVISSNLVMARPFVFRYGQKKLFFDVFHG
jgi:hypothetical protein